MVLWPDPPCGLSDEGYGVFLNKCMPNIREPMGFGLNFIDFTVQETIQGLKRIMNRPSVALMYDIQDEIGRLASAHAFRKTIVTPAPPSFQGACSILETASNDGRKS